MLPSSYPKILPQAYQESPVISIANLVKDGRSDQFP